MWNIAITLIIGLVVSAITSPQAQDQSATPAAPTKVLFMCPHGAGKSVLASAFFQRLATEHGLDVRVDAVGTDPDAIVGPAISEHLTKNGYQVPISKPRAVTTDDLATADVVVSLGCDLSGLSIRPDTLQRWDDVPAPSEDLTRTADAIRQHVVELVEGLVRRSK